LGHRLPEIFGFVPGPVVEGVLIGAARENVNRQLQGQHSGSAVRPDFVAEHEQTDRNGEERAGGWRTSGNRREWPEADILDAATMQKAPEDAGLSGEVLP
jgi:hypothetical protein